jgi:predicted nucleic acid-binding protein
VSLILVDTCVWARVKEVAIGRALAEAVEADAVVITVPILLELLRSARSSEELDALASEYDALHHVELTAEIAGRARHVQATLAKRGYHRGPSPVDLLAAAAAEAVGAELWHRDRDFELIAAVTGQPHRRL